MAVDIFLMGTIGQSGWRDPIKKACLEMGVECFDPIVPIWNDEAKRREVEALKEARVIVMAITTDTASIASLSESGWVALSALKRNQAFGIYIDTHFGDAKQNTSTGMTGFGGWLLDTFFGGRDRGKPEDTLEESSRRARKLVVGHLTKLKTQYPELDIYVAVNLEKLTDWAIATAKKLAAKQPIKDKPRTR